MDFKSSEIIDYPSEQDLEYLVNINNLDDCPITIHCVKNSHAFFCPDLAGVSGKTVSHEPDHFTIDYVFIPKDFLKFHRYVTLVSDVIFVNNIPFLITVSLGIRFITAEHSPTSTAEQLSKF